MRPANSPAPSRCTDSRRTTSSAHRSRGANSGTWLSTTWVSYGGRSGMTAPLGTTAGFSRSGRLHVRRGARIEKKPRRSGVSKAGSSRSGDGLHTRRLRAFRALGHFIADPLSFLQALEAVGTDCRIVHEHIGAAVLGCDESETLGVVEPLH